MILRLTAVHENSLLGAKSLITNRSFRYFCGEESRFEYSQRSGRFLVDYGSSE